MPSAMKVSQSSLFTKGFVLILLAPFWHKSVMVDAVEAIISSKFFEPFCPQDEASFAQKNKHLDPNANLVWPMSSTERTYFVMGAIKQLYGTAKTVHTIKIVEPYVYNTQLAINGESIFNYVKFDEQEKYFITRDEFNKFTKFDRSIYGKPLTPSVEGVVMLNFKKVENKQFSCPNLQDRCFCFAMTKKRRTDEVDNIYLEYQTDLRIGTRLLPTIFNIIRNSPWAKSIALAMNQPITIGLTDTWYHALQEIAAIAGGMEGVELSEYIKDAAKDALSMAGNPTNAIGWRIQRQFASIVRVGRNEENVASYIIGCELSNILHQLKIHKTDPVVLLFDIFANEGMGADPLVGPPVTVRKEIIRHLKSYYEKLVVFEAINKKTKGALIKKVDPRRLSNTDFETFFAWLDIAIGVSVGTFYDAGGHFAQTIKILRNNKGVVKITPDVQCMDLAASQQEGTDDIMKVWDGVK